MRRIMAIKKKNAIEMAKMESELFDGPGESVTSDTPDYRDAGGVGYDYARDDLAVTWKQNVDAMLNRLECQDDVIARRIMLVENVCRELLGKVEQLGGGKQLRTASFGR
jgi:hypothetical protein